MTNADNKFTDNQFDGDSGQMNLFGDDHSEHSRDDSDVAGSSTGGYASKIHIDSAGSSASEQTSTSNTDDEEKVPNGTKVKVLAALAVVAIATYVAYWVQEPLSSAQLKADVVAADTSNSTSDNVADTGNDAENVLDANISVQNVDASLYGFEPSNLTLKKGTKVVWTNTSSEQQTITGTVTVGSPTETTFSSPTLNSGETFSYTFNDDATFEYSSSYNPALKAKIVVGTGGSTISNTNAMDGTTNTTTNNSAVNENSTNTSTSTTLSTDFTNPTAVDVTSNSEISDTSLKSSAPETVVFSSNTAANVETSANSSLSENQDNLKPAAAEMKKSGKLASSGPEDYLYFGLLLGVLALNRKRFFKNIF